MYIHPSRMEHHRPLTNYFARSVNQNRDNWRARVDCKNKRPFLERAKRIVIAPRSLGENDYRIALTDSLRGFIIRSESSLTILAFDGDHSNCAHRATENGNSEELCLGDKLRARQKRADCGYVVPADMIREKNVRASITRALRIMNRDPHTGDGNERS